MVVGEFVFRPSSYSSASIFRYHFLFYFNIFFSRSFEGSVDRQQSFGVRSACHNLAKCLAAVSIRTSKFGGHVLGLVTRSRVLSGYPVLRV